MEKQINNINKTDTGLNTTTKFDNNGSSEHLHDPTSAHSTLASNWSIHQICEGTGTKRGTTLRFESGAEDKHSR